MAKTKHRFRTIALKATAEGSNRYEGQMAPSSNIIMERGSDMWWASKDGLLPCMNPTKDGCMAALAMTLSSESCTVKVCLVSHHPPIPVYL